MLFTLDNFSKKISFSKKNLLIFAVVFAAIGGYAIYRTSAEELKGLAHTNNTLVQLSDSSIYLIEDGKLRLVSEVTLQSRGFKYSEVRAATEEDAKLPKAAPLELAEGIVLKEADSNRQYITEKSGGVIKKRLINNISLLQQLKNKDASVIKATPDKLPKDSLPPVEEAGAVKANPEGTVVVSDSGVNYLIEGGKKRPVQSYGAYITHRLDLKAATFENEADRSLPVGAPLKLKEGSIVRGSQDTSYVLESSGGTGASSGSPFLDRLINRNKNKVLQKRPIRSDEVLLSLSYHKNEVIRIPDQELNRLPTGAPLPESPSTLIEVRIIAKPGQDIKALSEEYVKAGGKQLTTLPDQLVMEVPYEKVADLSKDSRIERVEGNPRYSRCPEDLSPRDCQPTAYSSAAGTSYGCDWDGDGIADQFNVTRQFCEANGGRWAPAAPPPPAPPPPPPPAPPPPPPGCFPSPGNDYCSPPAPAPPPPPPPCYPTAANDFCSAPRPPAPQPPPPPPPPPAPPPPPPVPPSPGAPAPNIYTWYFIGGNSWSYGVDGASRCEVYLSSGGYQPFTPSLGGTFTVTAGNGGANGQLKCWNNNVGPTVSGWAGPSANPTPPVPPGGVAPVIQTWAFIGGNSWSYRVSNSDYCEVRLSNGGYQPFVPSLGGTFTVTAGNGGLKGQLKCWNGGTGPVVSNWTGPSANPTPPPPAPPPVPPTPGAPAPVINTWQFLSGNSWAYNVSVASRCEVYLSNGGHQPFTPSLGGTFTVTAGDGGLNGQLKCWNNNVGPTVSDWAGPIPPAGGLAPPQTNPPFADRYPFISGLARVGNTLRVTPGTWRNGVNSFAYQWVTCASVDFLGNPTPGSCTNISGARSLTYQVKSAQVGKRISVRETATNSAGSVSALANATGIVPAPDAAPPPVEPPRKSVNGYVRMPDSPAYTFNGGTPPSERCGSEALVDLTYSVAQTWAQRYPNNKLIIGDLNAPGHASHRNGIDVDIFNGSFAANINGNRNASIELGKLFVDSGIINVIYYNDANVRLAVNAYALSKGYSSSIMQYWSGHDDHFHVRILDRYRLAEMTSCPSGL